MQSLEAACEKAEHLIHIATRKPSSVQHIQERNGSTFISIHQKLRELYEEQSALNSIGDFKHLNPASFLLSKLVERENLNTLIINLYPGERGYSLMVRSRNTLSTKGVGEGAAEVEDNGILEVETAPLRYENQELLRYLDNEELPQPIAELLEKAEGCAKKGANSFFYSGCVVAEVRDYRNPPGHPGNFADPECSPSSVFSQPNICRTHHVLLRPTTQSILGDVSTLTSEGGWSADERLALESQLVLATQGPLCLDPSPSISLVANRLHRHQTLLSSESLVRRARKFSWASMNRKRKLDQVSVPPRLPLQEFLAQRKSKTHNVPAPSAKLVKQLVEDTVEVPLAVPSPPPSVDVLRYAKAYERPRETSDCSPQLVEEYVLEDYKGGSGGLSSPPARVYHIRLTILQRPSNGEYLGELYVDRDYKEGVQNGSSCRFSLGTRTHATRYIQQFTEIFTEEGRKSVRISHTVPGQRPRITCTSGMREREAKAAAAAAAAAASANATASAAVAVTTPVLPNSMVLGTAATTPAAPMPTNPVAGTPNTNLIIPNGTPNTVVVQRPIRQEVVQPAAASTQNKHVSSSPWPTHPAFSALVNTLMNSAMQFQREASNNSSTCSPPRSALARTITSQPVAVQVQKTPGRKTNIVPHNSRSQNTTHVNTTPTHRPRQQPPPGVSSVQASSPLLASQLCSPPVLSSPPQLLTSPLAPSATTTSPFNAPERVTPPCISRPVPDPSPVVAAEGSSTSASSSAGLSVPGLSALLAGTPSADNPIPGINSCSTLLDRLTASSSGGTCPPAQNSLPVTQNTLPQVARGTRVQVPPPAVPIPAPPPAPPGPGPGGVTLTNLNLQSLDLTGIPGLQNFQVIPGLAVPISLALNATAAGGSSGVTAAPTGVLVATTGAATLSQAPPPLTLNSVSTMGTSSITAAPATSATSSQVMAGSAAPTTMVLTNATGGIGSQGSVLSLPVAQIVTSGVKGHGQQSIRTATSTVSLPQGVPQSTLVVGTLQKPRAGIIGGAVGSPAKISSRGILEPAIPLTTASLRKAVASAGPSSGGVPGGSPNAAVSPSVTFPLNPQHHQLQMALLKQPEQLQCRAQQHQQVGTGKPAVAAAKHRRRPSNTPSTVTAVTSVDPKQ